MLLRLVAVFGFETLEPWLIELRAPQRLRRVHSLSLHIFRSKSSIRKFATNFTCFVCYSLIMRLKCVLWLSYR